MRLKRGSEDTHALDLAREVARLRAVMHTYPRTHEGGMFGMPAFFVAGRVFCCVSAEGIGVRIQPEHAHSVVGASGCAPFKPFGRAPMPGWILRSHTPGHDHEQTLKLLALAHAALVGR